MRVMERFSSCNSISENFSAWKLKRHTKEKSAFLWKILFYVRIRLTCRIRFSVLLPAKLFQASVRSNNVEVNGQIVSPFSYKTT